MSTASAPIREETIEQIQFAPLRPRRKRAWRGRLLIALLAAAAIGGAVWYGLRAYRNITGVKTDIVPTAKVVRGDVTLAITARGELRGGNPEVLTAPLTGGLDMHLTQLKTTGDEVKSGDIVAQFDTTEQEFKLKEAEADLAEAEQHLVQARAQRDAQEEEDKYALIKAKNDITLAELD